MSKVGLVWMSWILLFFLTVSTASDCAHSHGKIWNCIVGDKCLDIVRLHRRIKRKSNSLKRPYILAVEGSHYHKLFSDCDTNKDGCIDIADVMGSKTCQRSCIWRQTMHDLAC
jgi:hypothetical protein